MTTATVVNPDRRAAHPAAPATGVPARQHLAVAHTPTRAIGTTLPHPHTISASSPRPDSSRVDACYTRPALSQLRQRQTNPK